MGGGLCGVGVCVWGGGRVHSGRVVALPQPAHVPSRTPPPYCAVTSCVWKRTVLSSVWRRHVWGVAWVRVLCFRVQGPQRSSALHLLGARGHADPVRWHGWCRVPVGHFRTLCRLCATKSVTTVSGWDDVDDWARHVCAEHACSSQAPPPPLPSPHAHASTTHTYKAATQQSTAQAPHHHHHHHHHTHHGWQ